MPTYSLPLLIAKSQRDPGKMLDGSQANDMMYGDYSATRIRNIRSMFQVDPFETTSADYFFDNFELMATSLFATGELQKNILRMIAHFKDSSGTDYSSPELDRAVRSHSRMQAFVQELEPKLHTAIKLFAGDVGKIRSNIDVSLHSRLFFNTWSDILGGLTIATNDIWAWRVEITEYTLNGKNYSGKYKAVLYDHFGLDEPDVDNSKSYGYLAGFRAWFILQHWEHFAYRPFMTVISLEYPFSGSL